MLLTSEAAFLYWMALQSSFSMKQAKYYTDVRFFAFKMEATRVSETLVSYHIATWHHNL